MVVLLDSLCSGTPLHDVPVCPGKPTVVLHPCMLILPMVTSHTRSNNHEQSFTVSISIITSCYCIPVRLWTIILLL